jgi:hypothetical protein
MRWCQPPARGKEQERGRLRAINQPVRAATGDAPAALISRTAPGKPHPVQGSPPARWPAPPPSPSRRRPPVRCPERWRWRWRRRLAPALWKTPGLPRWSCRSPEQWVPGGGEGKQGDQRQTQEKHTVQDTMMQQVPRSCQPLTLASHLCLTDGLGGGLRARTRGLGPDRRNRRAGRGVRAMW